MKALTVVLMLTLLTVGCQKSDSHKSKATPELKTAETSQDDTLQHEDVESMPTTGEDNPERDDSIEKQQAGSVPSKYGQLASSGGGGVDSSGGNLILSSASEVLAVTQKIAERTRLAVFRLDMQMNSTNKEGFEKLHGSGSYDLVEKFLDAKAKNGKNALELTKSGSSIEYRFPETSCIGDYEDRDASMSWKKDSDVGVICISQKGMQKLSPKNLANDVLALSLHEVAHLVGFNEADAQAVQQVALQNMGLLSPDDVQLKDYLSNSENFFLKFQAAEQEFRKHSDGACSTLSSMKQLSFSLFKPRAAGESLIMPTIVTGHSFAPGFLYMVEESCRKNDVAAARSLFVEHIGSLFTEAAKMRAYAHIFASGSTEKFKLISTFDYLNMGKSYEDGLMKYPKHLAFEDFTCRVRSATGRVSDFKGQMRYKKENGELGTMGINLNGDSIIMLRRMEGQSGFGFAVMTDLNVVNVMGLVATDGGGKRHVYANHIIPGVKHHIQFDVEMSHGGLWMRFVCDSQRPGEKLDLEYITKK